jgi:endonuclease III
MAVLLLARNYGLLGGKKSLSQLDVKPDIHVMRVFRRCGFIAESSKPKDAIHAAQRLHSKFPAALDAPAYNIGKHWCRPRNPKCLECPIGTVCAKSL